MRIRAVVLSVVVVVSALLVAGCGGGSGSGSAPQLGDLIGSSIKAMSEQTDTKVHYDVAATLDADPSGQATEETRKFLSSPVTLKASGGGSKQAVTLDGEFGLMGQTYRAKALIGVHETFVQLMGEWYGDRTQGLDDASSQAQSKTKADPAKIRKAMAWLHDHAGEVLDAQVTEGPDMDGSTWQAKGRCKPDGIVALAQENGEPVTASEREGIKTFCGVAEFTYVVGAQDRLPRRLRIGADLDDGTLSQIAATSSDKSLREVDRLRLDLDVKLNKWGEEVTYEAPGDAKPLDDRARAAGAADVGCDERRRRLLTPAASTAARDSPPVEDAAPAEMLLEAAR